MTYVKKEVSQGKWVVIGLVETYSVSWRRVAVESLSLQ
jgi:hypothetical protein